MGGGFSCLCPCLAALPRCPSSSVFPLVERPHPEPALGLLPLLPRDSRSGCCIPEANAALHGKSAPDVAEPLLQQNHEWGQGTGRAWGHWDSRRDLLSGQYLSARRGLSHPSGGIGRGTVSPLQWGAPQGGVARPPRANPTLGDSHWAMSGATSIGLREISAFCLPPIWPLSLWLGRQGAAPLPRLPIPTPGVFSGKWGHLPGPHCCATTLPSPRLCPQPMAEP